MIHQDTVDGENPAPVEVGSLSHYLQGFSTIQPVVASRRISESSTVSLGNLVTLGMRVYILKFLGPSKPLGCPGQEVRINLGNL